MIVLSASTNKDVYDLFLNEEKKCQIHTAIYGKNPRVPSFLPVDQWNSWFTRFETQHVKAYVIKRLSSQSYHSNQLNKLLNDRLVTKETREKIIRECLDKGYLDDQVWLKNFLKRHQKKMGLANALQKLAAKGFSWEEIKELHSRFSNPEEEKTALLNLIHSKYKNKNLNDFKERNKIINSLLRKGFKYEQIKSVIQLQE